MTESPAEREVLADRLHSAAIRLLRRVRVEDDASGVTPTRLSALSVVVFAGPLGLCDLASAERVRPASMSRTVAALEEEGLVRREPDPDDGRAILLRATPRGHALLEEARGRRIEAIVGRLAELEPAEVEALETAVDGLVRVLGVRKVDAEPQNQ